MANPRVIGVDFDDIVFDLHAALADWHNHNYGTAYRRADVNTYDLTVLWSCTLEEACRRVNAFCFSSDHANANAIVGAVEGLHVLKKNNRLVSISSRPELARVPTLAWILKHDAHVFESLYLLGHFHGESTVSKAEVCLKENVTVCIDDSFAHAQSIAAAGIHTLLFDTPWNQGPVPTLVTRVFSWEEILKEIG